MNFIGIYDTLNDEQKEILHNLYMTGVNHDGHSWVTYGDVEEAVAKLIVAERKQKSEENGNVDKEILDRLKAELRGRLNDSKMRREALKRTYTRGILAGYEVVEYWIKQFERGVK